MNICSFVHPKRGFLPCSGIGRHINGSLLALHDRPDVDLELLFARQWLVNGSLPEESPIRIIPFTTFGTPENATERLWKLTSFPRMDRFLSKDIDWVFCPMETRFPIKSKPIAVTIHDVKAFEPSLPWSNTRSHRAFRRRWSSWIYNTLRESRVVFTVSEYSRGRLISLLGVEPSKVAISGNGVDDRYFRIGQLKKNTSARPSVLVIGGLRSEKGASSVLNVAKELSLRGSPCQIHVVGLDEPSWANQATLLDNIILHGMANDSALLALMRASEALLFLSEYEGFGIPALEAMAAGVPPIVSNRASLPEVVDKHGFVVDPSQPGVICDIIEMIISSPDCYDKTAGIKHASKFQWPDVAKRIVDKLASAS